MDFSITLKNQKVSDQELLDDLMLVSQKLGTKIVTQQEYDKEGKYPSYTFARRFQSWRNALEKVELTAGKAKQHISEDKLFLNFQKIWEKLGRQPIAKDIKKPISKFAGNTYIRRFGSWNNTLIAFGEYMNRQENTSVIDNIIEKKETASKPIFKHRTKRNISDRLRFSILMRDGFTCQSCGRSPTTERGVELHVDHIVPWSKGGETEENNLQAKCKKCNLGKGNAFNK